MESKIWDIHRPRLQITSTANIPFKMKMYMPTQEVSHHLDQTSITRIILLQIIKGRSQYIYKLFITRQKLYICIYRNKCVAPIDKYCCSIDHMYVSFSRDGLIPGPQVPPRNIQDPSQTISGDRVLSVSGKKRCSHCKEELGKQNSIQICLMPAPRTALL